MRRWIVSAGVVVAAAGMAVGVACHDLGAIDPATTSEPDASGSSLGDTGSPDVGAPDVSTGEGGTCGHAAPPVRPPASDSSASDSITAVFALATLDFSEVPDGGATPYGYDLDTTCTCPGPDSCVNAANAKPHCDELSGRDNGGGGLIEALGTTSLFSQSSDNAALANGQYGLLIQLTQWNGQPDDSQVSVAVYTSNGLSLGDGSPSGPVKGDGTDRWTIDPGSVLGGAALDGVDCGGASSPCAAAFSNTDSYVAGGVLVANLDYQLSVGGTAGSVTLALTGSVLTATIVQTKGGPALTGGVLTGRWGTDKLLSSLAALIDPVSTDSEYLCGTDTTYQVLKSQICAGADITSLAGNDNTGAPCDSLSVAFGFTALPAQLAEVLPKAATPAGCANDAGTPFHDSCGP